MQVSELLDGLNALGVSEINTAIAEKEAELDECKRQLGQLREIAKLQRVDTERKPRAKSVEGAPRKAEEGGDED